MATRSDREGWRLAAVRADALALRRARRGDLRRRRWAVAVWLLATGFRLAAAAVLAVAWLLVFVGRVGVAVARARKSRTTA